MRIFQGPGVRSTNRKVPVRSAVASKPRGSVPSSRKTVTRTPAIGRRVPRSRRRPAKLTTGAGAGGVGTPGGGAAVGVGGGVAGAAGSPAVGATGAADVVAGVGAAPGSAGAGAAGLGPSLK